LCNAANRDNSLLARYSLRLQAYAPHVEIVYKPGRINSAPDSLSRLPVDMDNDTKDLDDIIIPEAYYISPLAEFDKTRRAAVARDAQAKTDKQARAHAHNPTCATQARAVGDAWDVPFQQVEATTKFTRNLQAEQERSQSIAQLRDYLLDNARGRELPPQTKERCEAQRKDWTVQGGLLKRIVRVQEKRNSAGEVVQDACLYYPTVLPKDTALKAQIFATLHDHPMAAHIGEKKFAEALRSRFYWRGWYQDSQEYIRTCDGCQRYKALRRLRPGAILPLHSPTPFHTLGMDLIGPLPPSMGKRYVLVMIDHMTRWPIVVALPSKEPKHIARALFERVVRDYDLPVRILSDRGGEFVNDIMEEYCTLLGIEHVRTAPYHPATNGKTERFNGFLKKAVAIVVATYGKSWCLYIDAVAFAYRRAPVGALGRTPFESLFLTKGRVPMDLLTTPAEELEVHDSRFHAQRLTHLAKVWQQIRDMQSDNAAGWAGLVDEASKMRAYHEGDYVLIYMPPTLKGSRAFATYWRGPFVVTRRLGPKTYKLHAPVSQREFVVSVDNMVPYYMREQVEEKQDFDDDSVDAAAGEIEAYSDPDHHDDDEELDDQLDSTPLPAEAAQSFAANEDDELSDDDQVLEAESRHTADFKPDLGRKQHEAELLPLELQPDLGRNAPHADEPAQAPLAGFAGGELLESLDPALFEEENEAPYAEMSYVERTKLVKLCIAVINAVNEQVQVKKSTIAKMARGASHGVFARKRMRKGLVIGKYRGRTLGTREFKKLYPPSAPGRYVMQLKRGVYVDAQDPREGSFARFINDPGPGGKPNVIFSSVNDEILCVTLRPLLPGEELFASYGDAYPWTQDERRPAPTDKTLQPEQGGKKLTRSNHPGGGGSVKTSAATVPDLAEVQQLIVESGMKVIPPLPVEAPYTAHKDFEAESLVLYANPGPGPSWLVGEVVGVDHSSPVLEIHRFGSMDLRKGKHVDECRFKPAWIDPKDGLQVYTAKPMRRYQPIYDLAEFRDVMSRDFYLTNANKLPARVRAVVSQQANFAETH
jgi:transposase InsO family protein